MLGCRDLPFVLDMLDGLDDLVYQLEGYTRYNAFSVRECALQRAESDPGFLSRHTREELWRSV